MAQEAPIAAVPEASAAEVVAPKVTFTFKPQLFVPENKAEEAVAFYKAAFDAEELKRVTYPKRKADQESPLLLCAEVKIAGTVVVICDQIGDEKLGSNAESGIVFRLDTEDIHGAISKAVGAGAQAEGEVGEDEGPCCAGLSGKVKDPFGYVWTFSSTASACA